MGDNKQFNEFGTGRDEMTDLCQSGYRSKCRSKKENR